MLGEWGRGGGWQRERDSRLSGDLHRLGEAALESGMCECVT